MNTLMRRAVAGVLATLFSGPTVGMTLDQLYFSTDADDLRSIDFDGTSFTGGFATVLESGFSPGWTGIDYDPAAGLLYFSTDAADLRSIGFDGTSFTGGFATVLESGFSPGWTGIDYDPAAGLLYFSTDADDLRSIAFDGTSFTGGFATVLESGFTPSWSGIALGFSSSSDGGVAPIPVPATVWLILTGLGAAGCFARRHRIG